MQPMQHISVAILSKFLNIFKGQPRKSSRKLFIINWLSIIFGAITLFGNLSTFLIIADWINFLIEHWVDFIIWLWRHILFFLPDIKRLDAICLTFWSLLIASGTASLQRNSVENPVKNDNFVFIFIFSIPIIIFVFILVMPVFIEDNDSGSAVLEYVRLGKSRSFYDVLIVMTLFLTFTAIPMLPIIVINTIVKLTGFHLDERDMCLRLWKILIALSIVIFINYTAVISGKAQKRMQDIKLNYDKKGDLQK